MLEALAEVFIQAAQPKSAYAAVDAVEGARLYWIDELAARLEHRRRLNAVASRADQTGRNRGSDLSEAHTLPQRGANFRPYLG